MLFHSQINILKKSSIDENLHFILKYIYKITILIFKSKFLLNSKLLFS